MASEKQLLLFDDFHSMLLERQALKEGLVAPSKWHALPTRYGDDEYAGFLTKEAKRAASDNSEDGQEEYEEPNVAEDRIRTVRDHFSEFSDTEPWRQTIDTLLTYVCLFPQATLSRQFFDWRGAEELSPTERPKLELKSGSWEDIRAETAQALSGPAFEDALTSFVIHPRYLFARYANEDYVDDDEETRRNYVSAFAPKAAKYWARALRSELVDLVLSNAHAKAAGSFVNYESLQYDFLDFADRKRRQAGHDVPFIEPLAKFAVCLGEHADSLITAQLNSKAEFICCNRTGGVKRSEFAKLADTALVVRANFSEHLKIVPAPRTIVEALELRDRAEIRRLSQLIIAWSKAASACDFGLESRIASDIEKAARDLKRISFVRQLADCELGIWIKMIAGQIPFFSNILSVSELAFYYLAKHTEIQNCWLSTR